MQVHLTAKLCKVIIALFLWKIDWGGGTKQVWERIIGHWYTSHIHASPFASLLETYSSEYQEDI